MLLSEVSSGRNNNLNIIRFAAALMVIFSHAYPLSCGAYSADPLSRLTGEQTSFGSLAVCVFFFFSGFLINRSLYKSKNGYVFFKARCLRIFPCLAVVVSLSAFVLGSAVTTYDLRDYLCSAGVYQYLLNIVFLTRHSLPGVFETNIYGNAVNGSLWTLGVEFLCYIVCYILWKTGLSEKKRAKILGPLFLPLYFAARYWLFAGNAAMQSALRACGMFYTGMLYDTFREQVRMERKYFLLSCAGAALSAVAGFWDFGLLCCLSYILLYAAFGARTKWAAFGARTEISYGVYLCAFPIQQTVTMLFGGSMEPWVNFAIAAPLSMLGGLLLCVFVEKPLAGRKRVIRKY